MRIDFSFDLDRHVMAFPDGSTVQTILNWVRRVYGTPSEHTFEVIITKLGREDLRDAPSDRILSDKESYHLIEMVPITVINKDRQPASGDSGETVLKLQVRIGTTAGQLMHEIRTEYPSQMDGMVIWRLFSDSAELLPKAEIVSGKIYKRIFSGLVA